MTIKGVLVVFSITAALLVACGGSGDSTESDEVANESISVLMNDIYFGESNDNASNPPVWNVSSGANVTIDLDNQGALQHNWAIVKLGEEVPPPFDMAEHGDILLYSTDVLDGGTTASATFTAPEPGEYLVICTVAGHYPSMQGKLVVN
jgi:uncharacterized cupredoxin-like copper-binding protein